MEEPYQLENGFQEIHYTLKQPLEEAVTLTTEYTSQQVQPKTMQEIMEVVTTLDSKQGDIKTFLSLFYFLRKLNRFDMIIYTTR